MPSRSSWPRFARLQRLVLVKRGEVGAVLVRERVEQVCCPGRESVRQDLGFARTG